MPTDQEVLDSIPGSAVGISTVGELFYGIDKLLRWVLEIYERKTIHTHLKAML